MENEHIKCVFDGRCIYLDIYSTIDIKTIDQLPIDECCKKGVINGIKYFVNDAIKKTFNHVKADFRCKKCDELYSIDVNIK